MILDHLGKGSRSLDFGDGPADLECELKVWESVPEAEGVKDTTVPLPGLPKLTRESPMAGSVEGIEVIECKTYTQYQEEEE